MVAALFVCGTATLVGIVLWIVADIQRAVLLEDNDIDIQSIRSGFAQEGIDEALEVIHQRLGDSTSKSAPKPSIYINLTDRQGAVLAGNVPFSSLQIGPYRRRLASSNARLEPVDILGIGFMLDASHYVFVGRDTHSLLVTRTRILKAFLWVLLGAIATAIGGGVLLANRLMRRVDAITTTCEAVVAGNFNQRVALRGQGSEWDRLARAINEMLNRISALLENLRQVSSDVAHDLRTPLTRMRNRLEQAQAGSRSTDQYAQAVSTAIEDTDQLLSMFSALLRISQVEAGTRASSFTTINLHELLDTVYELYRPVATDNGQVLTAHLDAQPVVLGDHELLIQMFSNLVENAIRHTPAGTAIRIELQDRGQNNVTTSITDNGPGVPAGEFGNVTRRFYRVSTSRGEAGHGLGLALVNAIVQLHGAALRLSDADPGFRAEVAFALAIRPS